MMNGETVHGMVAAVLHLIPLLEGLEVPFLKCLRIYCGQ